MTDQEHPRHAAAPIEPSPQPRTLHPRLVSLGGSSGMEVRRVLPGHAMRTIGPWCFIDHYGPTGTPMEVGPHPHCGIQTVSWLLAGAITHRDTAGHKAQVRPGELSLMTAGHGIAHSEHSRLPTTELAGVQLWAALPDNFRDCPPSYAHHTNLPGFAEDHLRVTVVMGAMAGIASPAQTFHPTICAAIELPGGPPRRIPLEPDFEYGVLVAAGEALVDDCEVRVGRLRYLGWGRRDVVLRAPFGAQLLLLGGTPMSEPLLMWWNFVARSHDEIAAARADWEGGQRFGNVTAGPVAEGTTPRIPAPAIPPVRLRPSRPRG